MLMSSETFKVLNAFIMTLVSVSVYSQQFAYVTACIGLVQHMCSGIHTYRYKRDSDIVRMHTCHIWALASYVYVCRAFQKGTGVRLLECHSVGS